MKPSKALRTSWGNTHLVIPDPHAKPDWNNDRFEWLGQWAVENTPDVIVCIGDWADMPSLCHYDKGTVSAEGRRYSDDIASVHDALEKFHAPINEEISRRKRLKRKQWNPRFIMCLGNHDARITTAAEKDPMLHGTISTDDLKFQEFGWEVYPFLTPVRVDGIVYVHYAVSGVMGRPSGGKNHGRTLINNGHLSTTVGHSHLFDYSEATNIMGETVAGMCCGVFTDEEMSYAGVQPGAMWWRGVVHKKCVDGVGGYEFEKISIEELRERYGED